jgi:hypothetical protein
VMRTFEATKDADAAAFAEAARRYSVFYQPTGDGRARRPGRSGTWGCLILVIIPGCDFGRRGGGTEMGGDRSARRRCLDRCFASSSHEKRRIQRPQFQGHR